MRTFDEILQEIVAKKNEKLPEINSTSKVAIWWIWANIVASVIFTFEQIFYKELSALETYSRNQRYGTLLWWPPKIIEFQLGDSLVFNSSTGQHGYSAIDESKKIIKQAAIVEGLEGDLLIKVAKEDNGILVALDEVTELPHVKSYIREIKPAGTVTNIISVAGDEIGGTAIVYYDGNYLLTDIKTRVQAALDTFKYSIDFINFNGVILRNEFIDVIREIDGIDDFELTYFYGKPFGASEIEIDRKYATLAGYFNYADNWIDNNFTFIPRYENSPI